MEDRLILHYNGDNSYLFVNGKEIYKLKSDNKNVKFPAQFCLGSISKKFDAIEFREISFKGNIYDFSVDYNAINKSNILKIQEYLMVRNKMK